MATTVTIASSGSLSTAARIPAKHYLSAIVMSAAWDAGDVTFQVSLDGGATFGNLFDDVGEVAYKAGAGRVLILDPANKHKIEGVIKIRSGTSASAVTQTAERVLTLYFEPA